MTTIQQGDVFTLVNVFTVDPDRRQPLIDVLAEAGEQTTRHLPGFTSADLHQGDDGRSVVNCVQWRSREHFEATTSRIVDVVEAEAEAARP